MKHSGQWRWDRAMVVAVILGAGLSPIAGDDFWWDMARGRAVFDGTTSPARQLLASDATREADWLGGVPGYAVFRVSGIAGLAIVRLALAGALLGLLTRLAEGESRQTAMCIASLGILAAVDALDSASRCFDLLAMASVGWLLRQQGPRPSRRRDSLLFLAMVVWANFGRLPVLGVFLVMSRWVETWRRVSDSSESQTTDRFALSVSLIAVCLTPRGAATFWDSIRLLIPRLSESAAILAETEFRATVLGPWDAQVVTFAVVCGISLACLIRLETQWSRIVMGIAVITIGWSSRSSMAACSIWLTILSLNCLSLQPASRLESTRVRFALTMAGAAAVTFAAVAAMGAFGTASRSPLGIGLSPRLDIRLFEAALQNSPIEGTARCIGLRSAGMLAWIAGRDDGSMSPRLGPQDTDERALLSGRLRDRVLLRHDLEHGIRNPQRREDGSLAGWWVPLQKQETSLLIVPAEQTKIIRSLEPTWWKPLSLDSPVIPFGKAGDPNCAARLIQVLQERHFVDQGDWSYSPDTARADQQHVDVWSKLTGSGRWHQTLRQARVFRAMHLNVAAMRVLQPAVDDGNTAALSDFAKCEAELKWTDGLSGHSKRPDESRREPQ